MIARKHDMPVQGTAQWQCPVAPPISASFLIHEIRAIRSRPFSGRGRQNLTADNTDISDQTKV